MERSFDELFQMAKEMGMTDQSAEEMANEHIARREYIAPRYVRAHFNACINGKITSKPVQRFLDKKFGFNSDNVHRFLGAYINRGIDGKWYACE